eukprot:477255_1
MNRQMQISQETFDQAVDENIEEFGMERSEAVKEAILQLTAQGGEGCLSRVNTSGSPVDAKEREKVSELLDLLLEANDDETEEQRSAIVQTLESLASLCLSSPKLKLIVEAKGLMATSRFITIEAHRDVLLAALSTVRIICTGDGPNKAEFHHGFMQHLVNCMRKAASEVDKAVINASLACVTVQCRKCDDNKSSFAKYEGLKTLYTIVNLHSQLPDFVVINACNCIKCVCTGDDIRKDFSCSYDNIKQLVGFGCVSTLVELLRDHCNNHCNGGGDGHEKVVLPPIVPAILQALRKLVANEDAVSAVVSANGSDVIYTVLRESINAVENDAEAPLEDRKQAFSMIIHCTGLLRNLAANDTLKVEIANGEGLLLTIRAMQITRFKDATLQEHCCAILAQVALRDGKKGAKIVSLGGGSLILSAMRHNPNSEALQRQACLALRNIAARSKESRTALLDEGANECLCAAGRLQGAVDEAYGALRDLGCDIQLTTFLSDGSKKVGAQAFGESKARFNTSQEPSEGLDGRIENTAASPASSGFRF